MMTLSDLLDNKRFMGLRRFKIGLVAILFGFLDISMHIPAIHTDMFGFIYEILAKWCK